MSNLYIADIHGGLGEEEGLVLDNFQLQTETVQLTISRTAVKWDISCLWKEQVCLENVTVTKPRLQFHSPKNAPKQDELPTVKDNSHFALPFAISVKHFQLQEGKISFNEQDEIRLGNIQTALTFTNRQGLTILPTKIQDLWLNVPMENKQEKLTPKIGALPAPNTHVFTPPVIKDEGVDWAGLEAYLKLPLFTLQDFQLPFAIQLEKLVGQNWQFQRSQKSYDQIQVSEFLLQASAKKSDVWLEKLWIKSPLGEVNAKGQIQTKGKYPLKLELQGKFAELSKNHYFYDVNWVHLFLREKSTLDLNASGDLNQTTALVLRTTGSLNANIHIQAQLTKAKMPFHLQIKSKALQYPFYSKAPDPYRFKNADIDLYGDLLGYQGHIWTNFLGKRPQPARIKLQVKGDLSYVAIKQGELQTPKGNADLKGQISWRNQLKWQSYVNLHRFDIKQIFENIPSLANDHTFHSELSGEVAYHGYSDFYDNSWKMDFPNVSLKGNVSQRPFSLTMRLMADQNRVQIPQFALIYDENRINMAGKLGEYSQFTARISAPNLEGLIPTLQANIQGEVRLDNKAGNMLADIKLNGRNIRFQDFKLQHLDVNAQLEKEKELQGQIRVNLADLYINQLQFTHVDLQLLGSETAHQMTLTANGQPFAGSFALQGKWNTRLNQWQGEMKVNSLQTPVGEWRTNHIVKGQYDITNLQGSIAPHCWLNKQAQLCFPTTLRIGTQGNVDFRIQPLDLAMLNPFLPKQHLQGKLTGEGKLQWQRNRPFTAQLRLDGKNIKSDQQFDYRHLRINLPKVGLTMQWENHSLYSQIQADIQDPTTSRSPQGHFSAQINLSNLATERKLAGQVTIQGLSLGLLRQLSPSAGKIRGDIFAQLQLSGDLNTPLLYGELGIKQIKTDLRRLPFTVQQGDLRLNFQGKEAKLTGALKTKQSELHLSGYANWVDLQQYVAQVHLNGENFYVNLPLDSIQAELKISPNVTLKVDNSHLALQGQVTIPWARIDVKQLPESGVALSPDLVILDGKNKTKQSILLTITKNGKTPQGLQILSNLVINIGNDVNFKAYGLDTELQGQLTLTERQGELGIYGKINLEKGQFTAYGQNLLIQSGGIDFSGMLDKPTLSLDAIRNPDDMVDNDVVAGLRVSGYVTRPKVQVYTIPATTEDQALSYLITGHSIDSNGDAGAGGSVGAALISLSLAKTSNIFNTIGNAFGISNLSLGTTGAGNQSQVSINGNITDRLQVRYGIGLFTGLAELTLKLRILPKLYLQSISGVNQAVDLIYQFEI